MGYIDAIADGVKFGEGKLKGRYLIPCELCGRTIIRTQYSRKRNYVCNYCKGQIKEKEKLVLDHTDGIKTKKEKRFDRAIERIKSQVSDFSRYEKAIKLAATRLESYDSVPEAMVAIELIKNKHSVIPQQKVGRYRVDFALPKIKKIIEIDGEIFHKPKRHSDREAIIQLAFGLDWKIIHIPAELISKDITKLEKIIITIK